MEPVNCVYRQRESGSVRGLKNNMFCGRPADCAAVRDDVAMPRLTVPIPLCEVQQD